MGLVRGNAAKVEINRPRHAVRSSAGKRELYQESMIRSMRTLDRAPE